jgi:hypothetical protein
MMPICLLEQPSDHDITGGHYEMYLLIKVNLNCWTDLAVILRGSEITIVVLKFPPEKAGTLIGVLTIG